MTVFNKQPVDPSAQYMFFGPRLGSARYDTAPIVTGKQIGRAHV